MPTHIHNLKKYKNTRKALRKNLTKAEALFWIELKNRQLGYKFRRQHSIGQYIVDFYCPKLKLIIELDGWTHDDKQTQKLDDEKNKYFKNLGFHVKRYNNEEILYELDSVLSDLSNTCGLINKKINRVIKNMPFYNWKILGHKQITDFLEKCLANEKLSHAYLFSGQKNLGKNYLARRFAQILQCQSEKTKPCEHCVSCQQIKKEIHPDVHFETLLEDKKNISIDQVRALQKKLSYNSFTNSYKIALINEAETFSENGWNSLLKTLEEPTKKTIIIMITSRLQQIPATVISRSQMIRFNPVPVAEIANHLKTDLKIEARQAASLAHLTFGRPGIAFNFIANPQSYLNYQAKAKDFVKILNSNNLDKFQLLASYVAKKEKFLETVENFQNLLQVWTLIIRDITLIKFNQKNLVNQFLSAELEKLKPAFSPPKLTNILKNIETAKIYLAQNGSPKLTLENLVLGL